MRKRIFSGFLTISVILSSLPVQTLYADQAFLLKDPGNSFNPGVNPSQNNASNNPSAPTPQDSLNPSQPLSEVSSNHPSAFYNYSKRLQLAINFRNGLYDLIGRNPAADEHKWAGIFREIVGDPSQPDANAPLPTYRRLQEAVKNNMNTIDNYRVELENAMHLGPVPNPNRSQEEKYHLYLFYNLEMDQLGIVPKGAASETKFQEFRQYIQKAGLENAIIDFYIHDPLVIERDIRDRAQQFGIPELGKPEDGQPRLAELMSITYQSGSNRSLYGRNLSLDYRAKYREEIAAMIKQAKFNIYSCLVPIKLFTSYVNLGTSSLSGKTLMDEVDRLWQTQFTTPGHRHTMIAGFTDLLDAVITGNLILVNGRLEPGRTRTPQILQILASRGIDLYTNASAIRIAQEITNIIMTGTEIEAGTNKTIGLNFSIYETNLKVQDTDSFPSDEREPTNPNHVWFMHLIQQLSSGLINDSEAAAAIYMRREVQLRKIYWEVLGRAPSETEVAYYAKKPSLPITLLKQGLATSTEGKLVSLYRSAMGREAGKEEIGHWLRWLQTNPNGFQAIEAGVRNSPEAKVVGLYLEIFGRLPVPAEVGHWVNWLTVYYPSGLSTGLSIIAAGLRANPQASPQGRVANIYQRILGRQASQAEINYWVAQSSDFSIIEGRIKNSPEGKLVDLYRRILGRTPQSPEINHWIAWLQSNPSGFSNIEYGLSVSYQASPQGRIADIYQRVFSRQPNRSETRHWLAWLKINPFGLPAIEAGLRSQLA